jgi:type III pantothenate kinase
MIILIDIGNSNIVISKYQNEMSETYRYNTDKTKSIDEYYVILKPVIEEAKGIMISSVVPELNVIFKNMAEKYLNITPLFVSPGIKTGVRITVDNPKEVGADLVASAAGVIAHYGETAIVVDMGTATTFTYIENRIIKGVAITAGLVTQRNALISGTSQLSQFEFRKPEKVIETNTIDCLNAGLLYSNALMVKGMIETIKKEEGVNPPVIITGGASRFIEALLEDEDFVFDDLLLLKGLITIYHKNQK